MAASLLGCNAQCFAGPDTTLSVPDAITLFQATVDSIESYDLQTKVRERRLSTTQHLPSIEKNGRPVPQYLVMPLPKDEKSREFNYRYRQVWQQNKLRVERLEDSGQASGSTQIAVADGVASRTINLQDHMGEVGPERFRVLPENMDYRCLYRTDYGKMQLVDIFHSRRGTNVHSEVVDGATCLVIDAPPEQGATLGQWGITVVLDPRHTYRPRLLERYFLEDGVRHLIKSTRVDSYRRLSTAVWVPTGGTTTYYFKNPGPGNTDVVTMDRQVSVLDAGSTWNTALSPRLFELPIPAGIQMTDKWRNVRYVSGKENTEINLNALVSPLPANMNSRADVAALRQGSTSLYVVAGLVIVTACLLAAVFTVARKRFRRWAAP